MARRGRRMQQGREWWVRLPSSPRPIMLPFPTPVCEAEARRRLRKVLGYTQLPPGTVVQPEPLLAEMKR